MGESLSMSALRPLGHKNAVYASLFSREEDGVNVYVRTVSGVRIFFIPHLK